MDMYKNKLPSLDNPNFHKNEKRHANGYRTGICMKIGSLSGIYLYLSHFFLNKVHIWVKNGKNVTKMTYCYFSAHNIKVIFCHTNINGRHSQKVLRRQGNSKMGKIWNLL